MLKAVAHSFGIAVLLTASFAAAETVTVRSGNGNVGARDGSITFLLGPADTDFSHPFTSTDFSSAQGGPAAFIVSRNSAWISGLSVDSAAKWIGTNATAGSYQGNTALYAVRFTIANTFSAAALTMHYAVDDSLGGTDAGVYVNGTATCNSSIDNSTTNFAQEHTLTCNGIGPLLSVGTNWFYIDAPNWEGPAGLLFSATITTSGSGVSSISPGGVVNAASSVPGAVAPGSIASAYGSFPLGAPSQAGGVPLPISLSGLSMQFGGMQTPLYYASGGQVNLQVPWELAGQTQTTLTATLGSQTSVAQTVNLAPFGPGIFSMNGQGTGQGAILDSQYRLVDFSNPATAGDFILIYCTGLGAVTNQPPTGSPDSGSPLSQTTATPIVTVGGAQAQVSFSGLAPGFVGLYQVDAQVPTGKATGPAVPVVVSIGGVASNTVTVAIQPFPPSPNPQPSITSLSPSSVGAGTASSTLTINGSGFMASSSVTFNGVLHGASLVNSGQLTITLTASDLATAGSFAVVVSNPPPGGGSSQPVNFSVSLAQNPQPSITSLSPPSAGAGSGTLTLTINGSGFIASSSVTFNGVSHATSLVNSGQLTITLTASDLATAGSFPVVVSNPAPAGGTSSTALFTVTPATSGNPQPLITSLTPASAAAGSGPLTLNIVGTGFIASSSATFNGNPETVSLGNGGVLITTLTKSDLSLAGNFSVVVTNPSPGGGKSNAAIFSVLQEIVLTGAWQGSWKSTLGLSGSVSASLSQAGSSLTGTMSLTNSRCFAAGGTVTGTISGTEIALTVTFGSGPRISFSGETDGRGAITGQYTVAGVSCVDGNTGGISLSH